MAESPRRRYSESPKRESRSRSRSWSSSRLRYRSRSRSPGGSPGAKIDAYNPGNNLYVTGLSTRVTERDLEEFFSREGRVLECRLVVDPRSKASRGFGFVTMDTPENAEHCIKYLNRSILDGRMITVEKARRKRARTPTPGRYLGVKSARESSYSRGRRPYESYRDGSRSRRSPRYSPRYSPYNRREYTPDRSPTRGRNLRDRSKSPGYSPYNGSKPRAYRSGSPYRSRTRSRSLSASPRPR